MTITTSFHRKPPSRVRWGFHAAPGMPLLVGLTDDRKICRVAFAARQTLPDILRRWAGKWRGAEFIEDEQATAQVVTKILAGRGPFRLYMTGTPFQHAVWKEILKIPRGQTASYADIARRAGHPNAVRAAGTACGANPVPLLVPCHRVLASNGKLGGFGGGLALKKKLLALEGVAEFRA